VIGVTNFANLIVTHRGQRRHSANITYLRYGMTLADAQLALEKEDRRAALVQLLDAWRISRSPAVAEIIDVISVDVTRALPKIEGKTRGEFQSAWLEVASRNDPADMGRLLSVLEREPCT
jgi:hypothetical protein